MAKDHSDTIGGLNAPVSYGEMTLVAGTQSVVGITGHDPGAEQIQSIVHVTRRVVAGVAGNLSYVWVPSTGTLTVNSDNAGDTSTVVYSIRGKGVSVG